MPGVLPGPSIAPPATAASPDDRRLPVRIEQPDLELQGELERAIAGLEGTYGIAAYKFVTGQTVRIDDARLFPSASLYKLVVLYETYRQVQAGQMDLTTPIEIGADDLIEAESSDLHAGDRLSVGDALRLMITISSNSAAYALLDRLGWERFNEAADELGLGETRLPVGSYAEQQTDWRREMASTSPRDILRFFQLLADRQLVDPAASDEMLAILLDQQINDRIPAGLPDGVAVAHKTGELEGVRHDAGIVFTATSTYILVVLTMDGDVDEETAAIAGIARRVHARYGDQPSAP